MASLAIVDDAPAHADRSAVRRFFLGLCALVVLARLSYVLRPLRNDEGGYLLIARQWRSQAH